MWLFHFFEDNMACDNHMILLFGVNKADNSLFSIKRLSFINFAFSREKARARD